MHCVSGVESLVCVSVVSVQPEDVCAAESFETTEGAEEIPR